MGWPSLAEYNAALLKAPSSFRAQALAGYRLVLGPMGMPMPVSGGYAYIYELRDGERARKALRCFREDDRGRRTRAAAVCRALARLRADRPDLAAHFIHTLWEENCLETSFGTVPAMVMGWAEGATLGARLEALQDDPQGLRDLRERLARMLILLASEGIVHGDLQTGNILIKKDGTPVLIDYDGLLLPGLSPGKASPDLHPNFQHPEWDDSCDPALKDRFPSLVLDLGLAAAAADTGLFPRFSTGENVLFRAEDLAEPESSPVFKAVQAIPSLSRAAQLLAGLALGPVSGLPSLSEFREEAWKERRQAGTRPQAFSPFPSDGQAAAQAAVSAPAAPAYRGVYPVFSAADYDGLSDAVGDKVEVIGRVLGVKRAHTKYGKPYAFINFGDWRRDGFKLTVWSEGLATFRSPPAEAWEGRWVSATGLVDEPYESERFGNTQLSITIQDASQLRFIDEAEALRRLGKTGAGFPARQAGPAGGSFAGTAAGPTAGPTAGTAKASKPSNEELLQKLRQAPASQATARPAGTASSSQTANYSAGSSPPAKQDNAGGRALLFVLAVGAALAAYIINAL